MVGLASVVAIFAQFSSFDRWFTFPAIFTSALLSGTRAAALLVFLFWGVSWFGNHRRLLSGRGLLVLCALATSALFVQVYVESSAGRGEMFTQQLERGGRVMNLVDLLSRVEKAPFIDILVGKGFGYGTNSGVILKGGQEQGLSWVVVTDNGYATWFLQFGVLGTALLICVILIVLRQFVKIYHLAKSKSVMTLIILMVPVTYNLAGNLFEQFGYLVLSGLSWSWALFELASDSTRPMSDKPDPRFGRGSHQNTFLT